MFDRNIVCSNLGDTRAIIISKRTQEETDNYTVQQYTEAVKASADLKEGMRRIKFDKELLKKFKVKPLNFNLCFDRQHKSRMIILLITRVNITDSYGSIRVKFCNLRTTKGTS